MSTQHQFQKEVIESSIECNYYIPPVEKGMYKYETTFLIISFLSPFISLLFSTDAIMFSRSGSFMLFFAAIAEFKLLNKINHKHLRNDCRVLHNKNPWSFSKPAKAIGIFSFLLGLFGTIIWGYGEVIIKWFIK